MRFALGMLLACLSGCSVSERGDDAGGSVSVSGRIVGAGAVAGSQAIDRVAAVNSPYSTLTDVNVSGQFSDVTGGELVTVETTVVNGTDTAIDVQVVTLVEAATFATAETWLCSKCFQNTDGESCNGLWEVTGGTILAPVNPQPVLGACDATVADDGPFCVTIFPDGIDCANPSWRVDYTPPGDGLWHAETSVTVSPGESWQSANGIGAGVMDVRDNHYARWMVVNQRTGAVLQTVDYAFNVIAP